MAKILADFSEVLPALKRENPKQMLTIVREAGMTTVRINSSSLGIILACARKSFYSLHQGLRGKSESPALTFGTAIHAALEVFYGAPSAARRIPEGFKEASDLMAFGHSAPEPHILYSAIEAFVKKSESLAAMPDSDKRSPANGIYILQEYFKTYINDPYVAYQDAAGPLTERTLETVLFEDESLRIIIFGTIDLVLRHEHTGALLPCDHKTTSIIGKDFFNRLKPNHQYSFYILLVQRCLGLSTDEFMVNALQVKEKPKTARGSGPHFTRQITRRTVEDLQEFADAVEWAVRSYLAWSESGRWIMGHANECSSYGGCQFLDVCSAPAAIRSNILESKFVTTGDTDARTF